MPEEKTSVITRIAVQGFKSIVDECEIEIRPLTILAGANSSGKSSIMQPLLMLKQTLEAPYDPGPLLIDGPNVRFTAASQFLSKTLHSDDNDQFQTQFDTGDSVATYSVRTTYKKCKSGFEIIEMSNKIKLKNDTSSPHPSFTLYPDMSSDQINTILKQLKIPMVYNTIKRRGSFLDIVSKDDERSINLSSDLESKIIHSIHLPGLRGDPLRSYPQSSTGPRFPGTFENYTASVIYHWQESKDNHQKVVQDAMVTLELTNKINIIKIGDAGIEVKVNRFLHDTVDQTDMVNISDVGLGVSQVLPVIVSLIAAEPRQLVYIEQPELHLHPRAQVALAQVLADAAKRGVRIVAETHSSLLLLAVQTLVAEGKLSPELVKLHWFSRNKEGITKVDSVDLDEAGTYGEWSVDFDDVSLYAQSRYLDAVNKVRFGKMEE